MVGSTATPWGLEPTAMLPEIVPVAVSTTFTALGLSCVT